MLLLLYYYYYSKWAYYWWDHFVDFQTVINISLINFYGITRSEKMRLEWKFSYSNTFLNESVELLCECRLMVDHSVITRQEFWCKNEIAEWGRRYLGNVFNRYEHTFCNYHMEFLLHFCTCTDSVPLQALCSRNSTWRNSLFKALSSNK